MNILLTNYYKLYQTFANNNYIQNAKTNDFFQNSFIKNNYSNNICYKDKMSGKKRKNYNNNNCENIKNKKNNTNFEYDKKIEEDKDPKYDLIKYYNLQKCLSMNVIHKKNYKYSNNKYIPYFSLSKNCK